MKGSEIRQNKITKQWVIYAPARRKRPKDFSRMQRRPPQPAYDPSCPFCPGREDALPSVIWSLKDGEEGWHTRVVPNKFPAVVPEDGPRRHRKEIFLTMPAYGHHEVIIETPLHNRQPGIMDKQELDHIVETYHRRYLDLMKEEENMMVLIFRNHGEKAGTSLMHPHSQLIATGMVPHYLRWQDIEAQRYFENGEGASTARSW